jgi:hypothetical protein
MGSAPIFIYVQESGLILNFVLTKNPSFGNWYRKGIKVLGDLYEEGILTSFENIKRQFDIPQKCSAVTCS